VKGPPPPVDAEFKGNRMTDVFAEWDLHMGRCFGSKSAYAKFHPGNIFIPNANIFCHPHGKVWWGDLDLASDKPALEEVAHRLRCRLYVLREADGRFRSAVIPHAEVVRRAIWHTGGRARVPGVKRFLQRAGFTLKQAALNRHQAQHTGIDSMDVRRDRHAPAARPGGDYNNQGRFRRAIRRR
jgi:hypothetical protein